MPTFPAPPQPAYFVNGLQRPGNVCLVLKAQKPASIIKFLGYYPCDPEWSPGKVLAVACRNPAFAQKNMAHDRV